MGRHFKSGAKAKRIVLTITLLMTFRTFQYFPGMLYVQEFWFVLCFMALVVVYPVWKISKGLKFSSFELYVLVLMPIAVLLPAWGAWREFGQPLGYGIVAQRAAPLVVSSLLLVNALRYRLLRIDDIKEALLFSAWGLFILYTLMQIFLDPSRFTAYAPGFVTPPVPGEKPTFVFQCFPIIFGGIYYSVLGMRTGRAKYYLAAVVLFFVSGVGAGRGLTVSLAAALLLFLYQLRGLRRTIVAAVKFACIAAILGAALYAVSPAVLSARIGQFSDAFSVALTGSTTQDASANARIFETLAALPYIQKHPLLGNGAVSNQWQGGTQSALGGYFYLDDIGVVGILFTYGFLGALVFLFQYRFAWSAAKKLSDSFRSPLIDATKMFLLFSAIYSLQIGLCALRVEVTLFFVALLGGIATQTLPSGSSDSRTRGKCSLQTPVLLP